MNAFMDGARSVNPDVRFLVTFIDSWYDPPKAKESAFAMMDAGADIMFAERFGVADAAVERGVKAVGNVIDTSGDYPNTILTSALWHMEPTIDRAIGAVKDGTFEAADYGQYSFMGYGGGSLVVDETLVSGDVLAKVGDHPVPDLEQFYRATYQLRRENHVQLALLRKGRPLVVVPRETPLSEIHLENMLCLARMGAIVAPAAPGFYHHPAAIDDLVDHVVGKVLDRLGVAFERGVRWSGVLEPPAEAGAPPRPRLEDR